MIGNVEHQRLTSMNFTERRCLGKNEGRGAGPSSISKEHVCLIEMVNKSRCGQSTIARHGESR